MAHTVNMEIPPQAVYNSDVVFQVSVDDRSIGRLKVSRGGVEWVPRNYRDGIQLSWSEFAKLIETQSTES